MKKTKLKKSGFTECMGYVIVAIFIVAFFNAITIWIALGALVFCIAFDVFTTFYITESFIQKDRSKLLASEIVDVRKFGFWYILEDLYGDTMWIACCTLDSSSEQSLMNRLGIDLKSAEQGAAANP